MLKISKERVRQIETKALSKLKDQLLLRNFSTKIKNFLFDSLR